MLNDLAEAMKALDGKKVYLRFEIRFFFDEKLYRLCFVSSLSQ